jgi:endo-1,3(4)-beta-glucanase
MAFSNSTPIVQSGVFFKTVTKVTRDPKSNVRKFNFNLEDGSTWRVYAWSTKGDGLDLQVVNNGFAEAKRPFTGVIQITKDPMTPGSEDELDDGAGVYPLTVELSGSASGSKGSYTFRYRREGHGTGNIYTYALPHHIGSFDD